MLVSCVMPTRNRRDFLPAAIRCFQWQTWPQKELVIVADGQDVRDVIPADPMISYHYLGNPQMAIGAKRNLCASRCRGKVICHFDDDDHSEPERLADQIRYIQAGAPITGYRSMLFVDQTNRRAWHYVGHYAIGTSLCYTRQWWEEHPFRPEFRSGEDNDMTARMARTVIKTIEDAGLMFARTHAGNTSRRDTGASNYRGVQWEDAVKRFPILEAPKQ